MQLQIQCSMSELSCCPNKKMPLIHVSNYEWNFQGGVGAFHEGFVDDLNMQATTRMNIWIITSSA
jgi:hypothetical protein